MLDIKPIDKKQFFDVLDSLSAPKEASVDFLYDLYVETIDGLCQIEDDNILNKVSGIDHVELIQYIIGEYLYTSMILNDEGKKKLEQDEEFKEQIISVIADKYLSLSFFSHNEKRMTNMFFPPISSLDLYVNFMLNIVQNYKQNDPKMTLVTDLLNKSLSITRCILTLLTQGYETEAFASWRTLHECECTLILLDRYKDVAIDAYLKHMKYGIAFKGLIPSKEETDHIFEELKGEMKDYDLKSKDMKKYIEYGWLTAIADFKNDPNLKLNFRDGLETLAGLHDYSDRYMESSEILHSTPLLIYSNKQYFYYITLLSAYESFFRLESVFVSLLAPVVSKELIERYMDLRKIYFAQLIGIHKREASAFVAWQKSLNEK